MNFKLENRKGITLIALVVTIIVLLILAGVSIAMLTGENGILTQASKAKEKTEKATYKEEINLLMQEAQMEQIINNKSQEDALRDVLTKNDKNATVKKSNTVYEVAYKNNNILISNNLEYIDIVEPKKPSEWIYTKDGVITGYNGNDTDIIIPNYINGTRIKRIGSGSTLVFKDITINSAIISEGIEELGYAIFNHSDIEEIIIPNSITTIGACTFQTCKNLKKVVFGNNIITIEQNAFYNDANLSICSNLPNTIEYIYTSAFNRV